MRRRFDPCLGRSDDTGSDDINTGVHAIHTGGDFDSHLLVPQISR